MNCAVCLPFAQSTRFDSSLVYQEGLDDKKGWETGLRQDTYLT